MSRDTYMRVTVVASDLNSHAICEFQVKVRLPFSSV
jgi:hypothetical protein